MSNPNALVQKLWNYCNILRDDGLSYGDYVEQLTFLLFLKMADEQSRPPFNKPSPIPKRFSWSALLKVEGDDLEVHYRHTLEELGKRSGMLGVIFRKAQNKIQGPAKLRRLIVDLIDKEQWSTLSADVKGDAYEGLLQKNAEDVKGGAGQYFTPRPLIAAMVDVVAPQPGQAICDPACGTGGFLLAAHNYLSNQEADEKAKVRLGLRPEQTIDDGFCKFVNDVYLKQATDKASYRHDQFRCAVLTEYFAGKRFRDIKPMLVSTFIKDRLATMIKRHNQKSPATHLRSPVTVHKEVTLLSGISTWPFKKRLRQIIPVERFRGLCGR